MQGNPMPTPARTALVLLIVLATFLPAQDAWEIRLALPWREFGRIDLAAADPTPGPERFLDGQVVPVGAGIYAYTVADPLAQVDVAHLNLLTYTDLATDARSRDLGDAPGIDFELRRELLRDGPWRLGLAASFRWTALETSFSGSGATVVSRYSIAPNAWPSPNPPGGGPDPAFTTAYFKIHDPLQFAPAGVAARVRHRIDFDLCEIALGGYAAWESGPVQFGLALSPVLALPRLSLRTTAAAPGWPEQAVTDTADDALLGLRLAAEAQWQFRPPFFLALAAEYEWFAGKLEGEILRADLAGPALRLAVGCRF